VRRALAAIDVDALSPAARIDFAIFRDQVESSAENIRLGGHRMPLNSDSAFWSDLAFLPRQHPVRDVADVERYIARLRAVPAYFDQHIELLREGLRRGQTVPRVTLEGREASIAAQAKVDDVEASPFYAPLRRLPASIGAEDAARLRTQAAAAIRESVAPAYAKLLAFMRDTYILGARTTLGASALPDGKAYYRRQIIDFVTEDLDPREIHATGLAEVARLRAAMEAIIREIEFDGDYAAFLHHLRTDPRYYAKSPDELLAQAAWIAKRADGALPRFFGRLPRRPYGVQAVPEAIAPYYTAGRYDPARGRARPPPADRARRRVGRAATVSPVLLHLGLWRGLGAVRGGTRPRDGHLPHAARALRATHLRDVARQPAGGGHRRARARLDPRAGDRLHDREHRAQRARDPHRGRPLHLLARAGAVVLPRHAAHQGAARGSRA